MKRSEINKALKELEAMCKKHCCYLPPFCHFTPAEWLEKGHDYDEVRDCCLGWDITDYGLGKVRIFPHHHPQRKPGHGGQVSQGLC